MDQNLPEDSGNQSVNIRAIFIVFLAIAILAGAVTYALNRNRSDEGQKQAAQQKEEENSELAGIAPNTFVYGVWSDAQSAVIRAADLTSGVERTLARLPDRIKKVTVLNGDQFMYIYNTDQYDHGRELVVYSITDQKDYGVYQAADGFGIDDYVVSPNGKYVATWEVAFKEGSGRLLGGRSRVYAANLEDPNTKHLLYDETQEGETPVHYPLAITDNGSVFTDQFLPGCVHCWGFGMSFSNFDGTQKEDLADLKDGMYGSQPAVSPDGKYLVFTGYTSPRGPVSANNRAVQRAGANTIELLDLQTRTKQRLSNVPTSASYLSVRWDESNLIYYTFGSTDESSGYYQYDVAARTAKKIDLTDPGSETPLVTLGNGKILVGADQMENAASNLGSSYSIPYTRMSVLDQDGTAKELKVRGGLIQYITTLPSDYFVESGSEEDATASTLANNNKNNKGNTNNPSPTEGPYKDVSECEGYDNLQLCPFYFKADLAPVREQQQTIPSCYDGLIGPECEKRGFAHRSDGWLKCVKDHVKPYREVGLCGGSPLYLYGPEGQSVHVEFGTDVFGAVPSYIGGYDVTLGTNGRMSIQGGSFERISYDYTPAIKNITRPNRGTIVAKSGVEKVLKQYASKLGLNEKETNDLVSYGEEKVVSPYVFISFFDQETSEMMLPISFSPRPDNYRNVVFYFRLLSAKPPVSVEEPSFPAVLDRSGVTAVEVSGFVE